MRLKLLSIFGAAVLLTGSPVGAETLWSRYPGFFYTGVAGIIVTDLDGDGVDEAVVSGSGGGAPNVNPTVFLAVLKRTGDTNEPYRIASLRRLRAGESLTGKIAELQGVAPGSTRIVATVQTSMSTRIVQYSGIELDEVASVPVVSGFTPFRQDQVGDIDGDGDPEVLGCVCGYFSGETAILSLTTGAFEWTDTLSSQTRAAGQLDADAALELVIGRPFSAPDAGRVLDGATRNVQWTSPDGFLGEIVFGNFRGAPTDREFAVVKPWQGTKIFGTQPLFSLVSEFGYFYEAESVAVVDTNADSLDEIIIGHADAGVIAYGTISGVPLFYVNNPGYDVDAVAVGELNGLPGLELIYSSIYTSGDKLRVVSIPSGTVGFNQTAEYGPHSSLVRGDIDGNGSDEIVYATRYSSTGFGGPSLFVVDAATGARVRQRDNVLEPEFTVEGLAMRLADVDADPQKEIIFGLAERENARVVAVDGLTLENQWGVTLGQGYVSDVEVFQGANGPLVAVAWGGRVVLLNARTGTELWRSVIFQTNGVQRLAIGNLDVDGNIEIALSVGTRAYVLDPVSGLVDRSVDLSDIILGHRVETNAQGCQHVFSMTTELRRYSCATGLLQSQRKLPFQSIAVGFVTDSYGTIVVSDGTRLRVDDNGTNLTEVRGLGSFLGWGNRLSIASKPMGIEVAIGGEDSVHMLRLVEALFGDGFE